jgi:hypothetical protein
LSYLGWNILNLPSAVTGRQSRNVKQFYKKEKKKKKTRSYCSWSYLINKRCGPFQCEGSGGYGLAEGKQLDMEEKQIDEYFSLSNRTRKKVKTNEKF